MFLERLYKINFPRHKKDDYCIHDNGRALVLNDKRFVDCVDIFRKTTLPGMVIERSGKCIKVGAAGLPRTDLEPCDPIAFAMGQLHPAHKQKIWYGDKCFNAETAKVENLTQLLVKKGSCGDFRMEKGLHLDSLS